MAAVIKVLLYPILGISVPMHLHHSSVGYTWRLPPVDSSLSIKPLRSFDQTFGESAFTVRVCHRGCRRHNGRVWNETATPRSRVADPWSWDWAKRTGDSASPARRRRQAKDASTTWGRRQRLSQTDWCRQDSEPAHRTRRALLPLSQHNRTFCSTVLPQLVLGKIWTSLFRQKQHRENEYEH